MVSAFAVLEWKPIDHLCTLEMRSSNAVLLAILPILASNAAAIKSTPDIILTNPDASDIFPTASLPSNRTISPPLKCVNDTPSHSLQTLTKYSQHPTQFTLHLPHTYRPYHDSNLLGLQRSHRPPLHPRMHPYGHPGRTNRPRRRPRRQRSSAHHAANIYEDRRRARVVDHHER